MFAPQVGLQLRQLLRRGLPRQYPPQTQIGCFQYKRGSLCGCPDTDWLPPIQTWGPCVRVLRRSALLFGVFIKAPEFWELRFVPIHSPKEPRLRRAGLPRRPRKDRQGPSKWSGPSLPGFVALLSMPCHVKDYYASIPPPATL